MLPVVQRHLLRFSGLATILLLTSLVFAVSCERQQVEVLKSAPEPAASPRAQVEAAPPSLADDSAGECSPARLGQASLASINDSGHSLYQASRCAAREGDFKTSLFHLYAAASAGYDNVEDLQTDPLLRPLYQSSRWQLVTDLVVENQRARLQSPTPETLCALFERVRSRSSALMRDTQAHMASHRVF